MSGESRGVAKQGSVHEKAVGALVVLAAVFLGWAAVDVLRFERSADRIRSEISASGGRITADRQHALWGQAAPWIDHAVVGARARSLMTDIAVGVKDPDTKIVATLMASLIERKPTYGGNWLSLAQLRQVDGASLSDVLPLVRLSTIFAPHDGHVMAPRVVLAIQNWEAAPADMKDRAISELLVLTKASGATFQWDLFAEVLADQKPEVRADVRERLVTMRPDDKQMIRQLGL